MEMDLPWMNGKGMEFDMEHMMNMQNMNNMENMQPHGERENDQPKMADVVDQLMQDQQIREIIQKWRDNTSEWDREEKEYTESDSDNYDNVVVTRVDNTLSTSNRSSTMTTRVAVMRMRETPTSII